MNTATHPKDHNNPPEGLDAIIAALREGRDVETELDQFEANVIGQDFDISTTKGRADVKSRAYDVSKMKGKTDAVGRELTSDWKLKTKVVTSACASIRTRLDFIRDSIREPLTKYENEREAMLNQSKLTINNLMSVQNLTSQHSTDEINRARQFIEGIEVDAVCNEFIEQAESAKVSSLKHLVLIEIDARERERDRKELDELRAERERREQEAAKKEADQGREREIEAAAQERVEAVKKQAELDIQASIKKQDEHKITDAPRFVDGVVSERHKPTIDLNDLDNKTGIYTHQSQNKPTHDKDAPTSTSLDSHWPETYEEEPATLDDECEETAFSCDIIESLEDSFSVITRLPKKHDLVQRIVEEIMKGGIPHLTVV